MHTRSGHITVTDMDNIELSNLNRQFLFRAHHVKQMKSAVAVDCNTAKAEMRGEYPFRS